jgi:hypothetical protein
MVVGALAGALVVWGATAAGADCSGPVVDHDAGPVDRGQEITVTGTGFGDNCYDTGPPPAGQGILGEPLRDVEVVIVQGDVEHIVAEGAADDAYELSVDVVVPPELEPGEALVRVRWGGGTTWAVDATEQALEVSDAPATGEATVAEFGPGAGEAGEAESEAGASGNGSGDGAGIGGDGDDGDSSSGWSDPGRWAIVAVVLLGAVGVGSMVVVRRS